MGSHFVHVPGEEGGQTVFHASYKVFTTWQLLCSLIFPYPQFPAPSAGEAARLWAEHGLNTGLALLVSATVCPYHRLQPLLLNF